MITVGLTGNVAGGKTVVADRWREAGIAVIDADRLGHAVLTEDSVAQKALVETFGTEIVGRNGSIDRVALGARAFRSPEATARLNAIVHPPLLERLDREIDASRREGHRVVVVDAALIFEFGIPEDLDRVVLVTAPRELRAERLARQRNLSPERIEELMAAQMPDAEKVD
ncbi:MAG: dephospho-CoA kinase, partial [Gemmatimonadota bacterium]